MVDVRRAERGALFGPAALHEGAASDLAGNQAALFGFGIGFRDRSDTEAEALCHVALGQKPHPGLDAAGGDVGIEREHESEVARAQDRLEVRYPVGHLGPFSNTRIRRLSVGGQDSTISILMQYSMYDLDICTIRK